MPVPAERVEGEEAGDDERARERHSSEDQARLPFALELRDVDLRPREEGEHDAGERADEREPVRDREVERVPDDDAERELDQRDGQADLDRDRAGDENGRREDCRYRYVAQLHSLLAGVALSKLEAISPKAVCASLIAARTREM